MFEMLLLHRWTEVGVQASPAIPEDERVPLAGGPLSVRCEEGGGGRGAADPGPVCCGMSVYPDMYLSMCLHIVPLL